MSELHQTDRIVMRKAEKILQDDNKLAEERIDDRCPRLTNWTFYHLHNVFTGNVYDHPNFEDGTRITTSRVVHKSDYHAQTLNTLYILGRKR